MSTLAVAAVLIVLLFVLLAGGLWIAMAMSVVGWFGLQFFTNSPPEASLFQSFWGATASWTLAALPLFIWSKSRIVPVRITDFSITEEAFDPALNPIRAKVSLGMRVLSVTDLGFDNKGGSLFMAYQQQKEQLAAKSIGGALSLLGIRGIP